MSVLTPQQMQQMIQQQQLTSQTTAQDPIKWIKLFNSVHSIKYSYKTESVVQNMKKITMNEFKALVRIEVKKLHLAKILSKQTIDDVIILWLKEERDNYLDNLRISLTYNPSHTDLIEEWVVAATGKNDTLDIAIMKHFVWQVRRKLYKLDLQHHLMPILYGKSGGGKSRAVNKLIEPLLELTLNSDFSIFGDQFKAKQFTKMLIMFFDEMAKSDRADVDKLKNVITSTTIDYRIMYTDTLESDVQFSTFIGCSNDMVYDKIYDPTSARRYWQLNCSDKLDWNKINSINYLDLWKSIDENSPCPLLPVLNEIKEVQDKTIRTRDLIEEWFDQIITAGQMNAQTNPSTNELYSSFKEHCEFQKINSVPTLNKFSRKLSSICDNHKIASGYRNNRGTLWPLNVAKSLSATVNMQNVFDAAAQIDAAGATADARANEVTEK